MMRATVIGSRERELLRGLPLAAQVLYTAVLRTCMDDQTAMIGHQRGNLLSMQKCIEALYVEPHRGMQGTGSPSRHQVRRLFSHLVKAGLIERRRNPAFPDSMVFFLPVAWDHLKAIRELRAVRHAARGGVPVPPETTNPIAIPRTSRAQAAQPKAASAAASAQSTPETRAKPAQNPRQTRAEPEPARSPYPGTGFQSPESRFISRFKNLEDGGAEKRSLPPPTHSSVQKKAAPNPRRTRAQAAPKETAANPDKPGSPPACHEQAAQTLGVTVPQAAPSSRIMDQNKKTTSTLVETDTGCMLEKRSVEKNTNEPESTVTTSSLARSCLDAWKAEFAKPPPPIVKPKRVPDWWITAAQRAEVEKELEKMHVIPYPQ